MADAREPRTQAASPSKDYVYAIGYLRAFAVGLVVAHHSVLAYHPLAPPPPTSLADEPRWWPGFAVVEPERWGGFAAFAGFNDIYFMSLLFFVSGFFVWGSLRRKGPAPFLTDHLRRLGLPFLFGVGVLAPLAYYPTYLQITRGGTLAGFWEQWRALGEWPSGPMWFLWVLLAFHSVAALLYVAAPGLIESLGRLTNTASRKPLVFFAFLAAVSALAYGSLRWAYHPLEWTLMGPFAFQTTRILHYLAYFLIGVGHGALGLRRGLLETDGKLARGSSWWIAAAFTLFGLTAAAPGYSEQSPLWAAATTVGFVLTCASSTLAFLALFLRYARSASRRLDSLSANSYAIYLLHYPIVNWLQYALLAAALPAIVKGAVVTCAALGLSWAAAAAVRRVPGAAHFV